GLNPGIRLAEQLLACEINREKPQSQSALLGAVEEGEVTIDGATRPLPQPFFVIATQNPASQGGTFNLPESQLDRFLMRLTLGYPAPAAEKMLLQGETGRVRLDSLEPVMTRQQLLTLQAMVPRVTATEAVIDYILRL